MMRYKLDCSVAAQTTDVQFEVLLDQEDRGL
jgi:hypothetical protein